MPFRWIGKLVLQRSGTFHHIGLIRLGNDATVDSPATVLVSRLPGLRRVRNVPGLSHSFGWYHCETGRH